jgi:retinol-binding protein 3
MNTFLRIYKYGRGRAILFMALGCLLAAVVPAAVMSALPPMAQPGQLPTLDDAMQKSIIDKITAALNKAYVFADQAVSIDSVLHAKLTAGAYREVTDPALFTRQLITDTRTVCKDRHLSLAAFPPSELKPGNPEDSVRLAEQEKESLRKSNFGFRKVEILPGNIGYLEFDSFADAALAGETAVSAMNFLANTDALIIDLRQNGGGDASMIQLLSGYFLRESEHLVSWYHRETDETIQSYSLPYVPGKRLLDTPLYILTSENTFSAAEEFTYDLKNLKRATIVGDTTGGGAHTVADTLFDFGNFQIGLRIPSGRSISPITKTNWEGVGVLPDLAVPADQALLAAKLEAIKNLLGKATDDRQKAALTWAQAALENEFHPFNLASKTLKQYAGVFGPRRIFMENQALIYQREGRPKYRLLPMGQDLFGLEGLDYFRLKFERNEKGIIAGLIGFYDDGRQDKNEKTK